jgi:hypothetical protein
MVLKTRLEPVLAKNVSHAKNFYLKYRLADSNGLTMFLASQYFY